MVKEVQASREGVPEELRDHDQLHLAPPIRRLGCAAYLVQEERIAATVPVTERFDRRTRRQLAGLLMKARFVVLGGVGLLQPWQPVPGSPAHAEPGLALDLPALPPIGGPLDLPLIQTRSFLGQAADELAAVGALQLSPPPVRFAAIGPLARASAERAFTVVWLLHQDRDIRVARSLALELTGLEAQLRYLEASSQPLATKVRSQTAALLRVVTSLYGPGAVDRSERYRPAVNGERLPGRTSLLRSYYTDEPAIGASAYGELSVFTHPTAALADQTPEWSAVGLKQVLHVPRSSIHDEGRLLDVPLLGLLKATEAVADYLGRSSDQVVGWSRDIFVVTRLWCLKNGCAPSVRPG